MGLRELLERQKARLLWQAAKQVEENRPDFVGLEAMIQKIDRDLEALDRLVDRPGI